MTKCCSPILVDNWSIMVFQRGSVCRPCQLSFGAASKKTASNIPSPFKIALEAQSAHHWRNRAPNNRTSLVHVPDENQHQPRWIDCVLALVHVIMDGRIPMHQNPYVKIHCLDPPCRFHQRADAVDAVPPIGRSSGCSAVSMNSVSVMLFYREDRKARSNLLHLFVAFRSLV